MEKITWKCSKCGYTYEAEAGEATHNECPSCKQKCEFLNVTCYTPDCADTGQDTRF